MLRRTLILGFAFGLAVAGPAAAQDVVDSIITQLRDQGFAQIETQRTLLGRTRIVATGDGGVREIIVNANTGEILRDLWEPDDDSAEDGVKVLNREGSDSSGSRSGKTSDSSDDGGSGSDRDSSGSQSGSDGDSGGDSDSDSDHDFDNDGGGSGGNSGSGSSGSGGSGSGNSGSGGSGGGGDDGGGDGSGGGGDDGGDD